MMRAIVDALTRPHQHHTQLGRWCIPTAPAYAQTCNQKRKADLANRDNCMGAAPQAERLPKKSEEDRSTCPVSRIVVDGFGM
jgi:hypothetical protein